MIKRFSNYSNKPSNRLLYYAFDWDDNILIMPTTIKMERKENNEWKSYEISTKMFSEVRNDENWRPAPDAFSNFGDKGVKGSQSFIIDIRSSINDNSYGPSYPDFIECITNGCLFAIITARMHQSKTIRKGVEFIINNVLDQEQLYLLYNNLRKFNYLFNSEIETPSIMKEAIPSNNELISKYLDCCLFAPVACPDYGYSDKKPEEAKEIVLMKFINDMNNYAKQIGREASIGFSDDDLKNVKQVEDLMKGLNKEIFSHISEYSVMNTNNPDKIRVSTKCVETSEQTPGLESSVLKFTQFGNMTGHLYPSDADIRQDDYANFMRRKTKYLTKLGKELEKEKPTKIKRQL